MKLALLAIAAMVLSQNGCSRRAGRYSYSIEDAKSRGIFVAEYAIPSGAKLGPYEPVQIWIEHDRNLVVRLKGPHVDTEPRVQIRGLTSFDYRSIWSDRDGPPYEVWRAPDPTPISIVLERGSESVEVRRRD